MSSTSTESTGRPGRYRRSGLGLIVSLVVTLVGIGALLAFMGLFRNDYETRPEAVDYLDTVSAAQEAGLNPVYPASVPDDWIATGVDVVPGEEPAFMVRFLTDDDRFIGVRREDSSTSALLSVWVDEETQQADDYTVPSDVRRPVARTWETYTDEGGDTAYVAEVGEERVIVFGSAPAQDLQTVVNALTTDKRTPEPAAA